jgi:hypothetical protein
MDKERKTIVGKHIIYHSRNRKYQFINVARIDN